MAGAGPRRGSLGLGLGLATARQSSLFVTEYWLSLSGTFMADMHVLGDRDPEAHR